MYNHSYEKTTPSQKIFHSISNPWPGISGHRPCHRPDCIFMDRNCFCPPLAGSRREMDAPTEMIIQSLATFNLRPMG